MFCHITHFHPFIPHTRRHFLVTAFQILTKPSLLEDTIRWHVTFLGGGVTGFSELSVKYQTASYLWKGSHEMAVMKFLCPFSSYEVGWLFYISSDPSFQLFCLLKHDILPHPSYRHIPYSKSFVQSASGKQFSVGRPWHHLDPRRVSLSVSLLIEWRMVMKWASIMIDSKRPLWKYQYNDVVVPNHL